MAPGASGGAVRKGPRPGHTRRQRKGPAPQPGFPQSHAGGRVAKKTPSASSVASSKAFMHKQASVEKPSKPSDANEDEDDDEDEEDAGAMAGAVQQDSSDDGDESDDAGEDTQAPVRKPRRVIKPKGKKGKKFADQSAMLALVDSLNSKEEQTIERKLAKRAVVHQALQKREDKAEARQQEKRAELTEVKKKLADQSKNKRKERKEVKATAAAAIAAKAASGPRKQVRFQ
ncbi:hypothetical protein BC831DRAFT_443413 [Entophlyctis helioformis]|nr:hypothetical protein BC831DRAFT_443413 [Entophlyctis helioformis]